MNEVNDENNGDSSDSEREDAEYASDDDAELSFESDDEGNYQQNQKRAAEIARKFSENDSDFIDGEEETESDGDEEAESDEDDDDAEEEAESNEDDVDEEDIASNESETEGIDGEQSDGEPADGTDSDLSFESSEDEQPKETSKAAEKNKKNKKSTTNGHNGGAVSNGESSMPTVSAADAFKNELNGRDPLKKEEVDEYAEHDTDDEEDIRNTVGNIPMHWYDEYKHIGYDWDAKKIIKPAKRDQLDDFLKRMEDPDFWRTVKDPQTGQDVILSDADIDLIKRINSQRIPDADFDDYTVRMLAIEFDSILFM